MSTAGHESRNGRVPFPGVVYLGGCTPAFSETIVQLNIVLNITFADKIFG
jgi:hypothetical protein